MNRKVYSYMAAYGIAVLLLEKFKFLKVRLGS